MYIRRMLLLFLSAFSVVLAELPSNHTITDINTSSVRSAYEHLLRYDYDSVQDFHPYFLEAVNTILRFYGTTDTLIPYNGDKTDTTLDYYFRQLEDKGITIYLMDKIQGKNLRALLYGNIPVLIAGNADNLLYKKRRLHADVLYGYRLPFQQQSSRILPQDVKHVLVSARGFALEVREKFTPETRELHPEENNLIAAVDGDPTNPNPRLRLLEYRTRKWMASPLKRPPYDTFMYYCVITTRDRKLDKIKQSVENGLTDAGFEYKVPVFRKLDWKNLVR